MKKPLDILNHIGMILIFMIFVYPFYYVFILSISDPGRPLNNVYLWPNGFSIVPYTSILKQSYFGNAFMISILRTVLGTILTLFCCSLFGFILSKKFFLKKLIYRMLVVTMYVNAGLIPYYITIKMYNLMDNFLVYIIPAAISAFYIVLIKTFMEQLPPSLEESARIDGAGFFKVYLNIILPVSKPIMATIAVFSAVGQWNNWMDNYLFVQNDHMQTLQLVLYRYLTEAESYASRAQKGEYISGGAVLTAASIRMAITMITTFPILIVYPLLQKYFVKGILLGAVKA